MTLLTSFTTPLGTALTATSSRKVLTAATNFLSPMGNLNEMKIHYFDEGLLGRFQPLIFSVKKSHKMIMRKQLTLFNSMNFFTKIWMLYETKMVYNSASKV